MEKKLKLLRFGTYKISDHTYKKMRLLVSYPRFSKVIFELRVDLGIPESNYLTFSEDPVVCKELFVKHFNNLSDEKKKYFESKIWGIVEEYNLPHSWANILHFFAGTGLVLEPEYIKLEVESKGIKLDKRLKLDITILGNVSSYEWVKFFRDKYKELKPEFKKLPRIPRIGQHKDTFNVDELILRAKSLGYTSQGIVDNLPKLQKKFTDIPDLDYTDVDRIYNRVKKKIKNQ